MTTPDAGRPVAPAPPPGLPPYAVPAPGSAPVPSAAPGPSVTAFPSAAPSPYAPPSLSAAPGPSEAPGPSAPPGPYAAPPGPPPAPYPVRAAHPGPWAPLPRRTDGLAVASLVLSCLAPATALLTAPVGMGLGIGALRRIRRTGADGHGLAVGGVVVGAVLTVLLVVLGVAVASAVVEDAPSGGAAPEQGWPVPGEALEGTTLPPFRLTDALVPGDCLAQEPMTYDMSDAVAVDCASGHLTEVLEELAMATPVLEDLTVPDATYTDLLDRCQAVAEQLLDPETITAAGWTDVYYPHPDQWDAGGRDAYCVLTTEAPATGSVRTGTFAAGTGSLPGTEV